MKVFEHTTQLTYQWVNDVAATLGLTDQHQAFQGLRATLHVLRDRLTMGEAANLGGQLPILLAGFYYEGWKPESTPTKIRTKADFLDTLRANLSRYQNNNEPLEPEIVARGVFRVLSDRIPAGEIEDIKGILPPSLKDLFPETART